MNFPLFYAILTIMGVVYVWMGKTSSKDLESSEDYFFMGRKLTLFPMFLTLLATQLGGGALIGAADEGFLNSWWVLFYPLGATLGFFALATGFGGKLRDLNISTIAEIFEKVYGSIPLRKAASVLSILTLFFILVAQGIASRTFFHSLGIDSPLIFFAFWAVLILYTVMGGLKAVVKTDILQALFIVIVLVLTFFVAEAPEISVSAATPEAGSGSIPWIRWLLMPLLFMLIEQDMGQRCFAAINSRVVSIASICAGLTLFLTSSIAIYFGIMASKSGLSVSQGESVLIEMVKIATNPTVTAFFMVAIFVAVISTADSLLCSIGSNLYCDFLTAKVSSSEKQIAISRWLTLATGLLSFALTFLFDSVLSVLMLSYELSVSLLFVPVIIAVLAQNPSRLGASVAMGSGAVSFALFFFFDPIVPREILVQLFAFGGYVVGALLDQRIKVENCIASENAVCKNLVDL